MSIFFSLPVRIGLWWAFGGIETIKPQEVKLYPKAIIQHIESTL